MDFFRSLSGVSQQPVFNQVGADPSSQESQQEVFNQDGADLSSQESQQEGCNPARAEDATISHANEQVEEQTETQRENRIKAFTTDAIREAIEVVEKQRVNRSQELNKELIGRVKKEVEEEVLPVISKTIEGALSKHGLEMQKQVRETIEKKMTEHLRDLAVKARAKVIAVTRRPLRCIASSAIVLTGMFVLRSAVAIVDPALGDITFLVSAALASVVLSNSIGQDAVLQGVSVCKEKLSECNHINYNRVFSKMKS